MVESKMSPKSLMWLESDWTTGVLYSSVNSPTKEFIAECASREQGLVRGGKSLGHNPEGRIIVPTLPFSFSDS